MCDSVNEEDITNINATNRVSSSSPSSRRLSSSDVSGVDVSYDLEIDVDIESGENTSTVFSTVVDELTTAVSSGTLNAALHNQSVFAANVSLVNTSDVAPTDYEAWFPPIHLLTPVPSVTAEGHVSSAGFMALFSGIYNYLMERFGFEATIGAAGEREACGIMMMLLQPVHEASGIARTCLQYCPNLLAIYLNHVGTDH